MEGRTNSNCHPQSRSQASEFDGGQEENVRGVENSALELKLKEESY
jgi:hypothetical protein